MKKTFAIVSLMLLAAGRTFSAAYDAEIARFAASKEAQAREFATALTNKVPDITWSFFDAVKVDDWQTATNLGERLQQISGRYEHSDRKRTSEALQSPVWQTISETLGAYEQFHNWDGKWLRRFGKEIIDSIPRSSIYFGGTDPGRFVITVLSESHREGKPFFTITQNQLADATYLDYVRRLYGRKIYVASEDDSRAAFQSYVEDARHRLEAGQLKPGEDVRTVNNKVQVSGQVAVMTINGLIAKTIIEKNPDCEIYVEESFPLDWMYPQLLPHGLIMKLATKPVASLREETVQQDQDYWQRLTTEIFDEAVTSKTSIKELCERAEKIYLRKEIGKWDTSFTKNGEAQKTFSKLRSSIGGVYAWRASHATDPDEKEHMTKAADLAFKQAFLLCPYSPEAVFRYTQLLTEKRRFDDAILIATTSLRFDKNNTHTKQLLQHLRTSAKQQN